jgi:regulatory protein
MSLSLKARALRYLAAREHSRIELSRKLARYAQEGEDIGAVLDSLEAAQFLSQQRFGESLLHRRMARFGNARILAELKQHQLEPELMADLRSQLQQDELERARQVWQARFGKSGKPGETPAERAKQIRFLAQRGFSGQIIGRVLRCEVEEYVEE